MKESKIWRWGAVLALCCTVGLVGCSSGSDSDGASGTATTVAANAGDEGGGDDSDAGSQQPLTQSDAAAFLEAAVLGNGDEAFSECLGEKVYAASQDGDLTPDDVRAWTNGDAPSGPVQEFISQPEIIQECQAAAAGGTDGSETTEAG